MTEQASLETHTVTVLESQENSSFFRDKSL